MTGTYNRHKPPIPKKKKRMADQAKSAEEPHLALQQHKSDTTQLNWLHKPLHTTHKRSNTTQPNWLHNNIRQHKPCQYFVKAKEQSTRSQYPNGELEDTRRMLKAPRRYEASNRTISHVTGTELVQHERRVG